MDQRGKSENTCNTDPGSPLRDEVPQWGEDPGSPLRDEVPQWGIDLHIHTSFSPDSWMSPRRACITAQSRGLDIVGFTDHAEFVNQDEAFIVDNYKGEEILSGIQQLRNQYAGRLEILFGVEAGYIPGLEADIEAFLNKYPFDYAIGSVHYVQGELVSGWIRKRELQEKDFMPYFETMLKAAQSGLFQVLGHLDYVRKYMFAPQAYERERYVDIVEEILKTAAGSNLTLELNTSGWRHATGEPYPGDKILRSFHQLGGKVTVGSDAHKYYEVGYGNGKARGLLKDAGFGEIQVFRQRRRFSVPV